MRVIEQPAHRARAAESDALVDFGGLLGDVDVPWHVAAGSAAASVAPSRRATPHAGYGKPCRRAAFAFFDTQDFQQSQKGIDLMPEPRLPLRQRAPVESAAHVQHRQQGQSDPGFARCGNDRPRHRCRIGIRPAVRGVMQVVELADLGVAGAQHLDVELRGDRMQVVGRDPRRERVHRLAPAPEAVDLTAPSLCESGHRALERMRVQVRDAGKHPARVAFRFAGSLGATNRSAASQPSRTSRAQPSGHPCMRGVQNRRCSFPLRQRNGCLRQPPARL